ncbi:unnamed protein product [Rotaria sp. Silwood1]|nr:unnamed protein product [Rotaria sp. Silwood1]CAF0955724.1 unnamed protein product [Rotaria sp. Silwood1]CAF1120312.1 unnamed protein product [Rotaria sp. Silwood1]CAF3331388.1 unnamed protein product [Rotaria sp. Silwood1]CAF3351037.1 unnamed protein product [Rotaria sp. Silwood1]
MLQPFVIQQVYDAFMDRAGKSGKMKINAFKMAYLETNPCANIYNLDMDAERAFLMFDTDRNGVLTFDEFLIAFVQMQLGSNNLSNCWQ